MCTDDDTFYSSSHFQASPALSLRGDDILKTPTRSILTKVTNKPGSQMKKRRVVFAGDEEETDTRSRVGSSSDEDAMELDVSTSSLQIQCVL